MFEYFWTRLQILFIKDRPVFTGPCIFENASSDVTILKISLEFVSTKSDPSPIWFVDPKFMVQSLYSVLLFMIRKTEYFSKG